jgi:hypothetical protein
MALIYSDEVLAQVEVVFESHQLLARHSGIVDKWTAGSVLRDAPEVAAWAEAAYLGTTKVFVDRQREHGRDKSG